MLKSTGVVRHLDPLGRITLPKELRRTLEIEECGALEIFVAGRDIVLRKYEPGCTFCGRVEGLKSHRDKLVCPDCITALRN